MNNLMAQETIINATEQCLICEGPYFETFTDKKGDLFRAFQKEYGKCVSKIYIDKMNNVYQVGWVFEKQVKYEDCNQYYIQSVWISIQGMYIKH